MRKELFESAQIINQDIEYTQGVIDELKKVVIKNDNSGLSFTLSYTYSKDLRDNMVKHIEKAKTLEIIKLTKKLKMLEQQFQKL